MSEEDGGRVMNKAECDAVTAEVDARDEVKPRNGMYGVFPVARSKETRAGRLQMVLDLLSPPPMRDETGTVVYQPPPMITKEQALKLLEGEMA